MNKKILFVMALSSLILLSGCIVYGGGKTYGYITTVDDGIFWDNIWIRPELESSTDDCYIINDNQLKTQLQQLALDKVRLELRYNRHLFAMTKCEHSDEVIGYKIIE